MLRRGIAKVLILVALGLAALYVSRGVYVLVRWKAYLWFPSYVRSIFSHAEQVPDAEKHLLFLMVDHYEPGSSSTPESVSQEWLARFRPVADAHHDSYGRRFQYSWFYPYDEHNDRIVDELCAMTREGYGELELHWHHKRTDSAHFPAMLESALQWFQRHGALRSPTSEARNQFAFIHGHWALDGSQILCGVNRELDALFRAGCYADFSFSAGGTVSQPKKINSIYYVTDTDDPKSYDDGSDVAVGQPVEDRLMIFEGPIGIDWRTLRVDAAAGDSPPSRRRIERWIGANIHVAHRPEWVFVKTFAHGIQYRNALFGTNNYLDRMLTDLEQVSRSRGIQLHYVTAREAYNIVKAAEDGRSGNPEDYRDYKLQKPTCLPDAGLSDSVHSGQATEEH